MALDQKWDHQLWAQAAAPAIVVAVVVDEAKSRFQINTFNAFSMLFATCKFPRNVCLLMVGKSFYSGPKLARIKNNTIQFVTLSDFLFWLLVNHPNYAITVKLYATLRTQIAGDDRRLSNTNWHEWVDNTGFVEFSMKKLFNNTVSWKRMVLSVKIIHIKFCHSVQT